MKLQYIGSNCGLFFIWMREVPPPNEPTWCYPLKWPNLNLKVNVTTRCTTNVSHRRRKQDANLHAPLSVFQVVDLRLRVVSISKDICVRITSKRRISKECPINVFARNPSVLSNLIFSSVASHPISYGYERKERLYFFICFLG